MLTQLVTPAASLPLKVAEAKNHLRVMHDQDDDDIRALIETATAWLEASVGRSVVATTWRQSLDCFPANADYVDLSKSPLVSVASITYYDEDNVSQTLDAAKYHVAIDHFLPGWVQLVNGEEWPSTIDRPDAVTIEYTAGYSPTPAAAKQIIKLLVGHWYENREAVVVGAITKEVEIAVASLTRTLKTGFVAGV
jgi:uncharacterized phiE125 gp8 family phage protein